MWPQAASHSPSADKPRTQPHRLSLDNQQLAPKDRKSSFSGKAGQRPALRTSTETSRRSPIPPAPSRWEGERVALCRQGCRACGLRPFFLHPAGSVGSFQGCQGFASPRSSPVRCSLVPRCAPRAASGRALDTLSTQTAKHAIRKRPSSPQGPFPGFCIPKGTPRPGKRSTGRF